MLSVFVEYNYKLSLSVNETNLLGTADFSFAERQTLLGEWLEFIVHLVALDCNCARRTVNLALNYRHSVAELMPARKVLAVCRKSHHTVERKTFAEVLINGDVSYAKTLALAHDGITVAESASVYEALVNNLSSFVYVSRCAVIL